MKIRLSIDRFEGDRKEIAVLVADDGTQLSIPRRLLPRGVAAGDVLALSLERDVDAARQLARRTKDVQDALKKTDPGGDIAL